MKWTCVRTARSLHHTQEVATPHTRHVDKHMMKQMMKEMMKDETVEKRETDDERDDETYIMCLMMKD